MKRDEKGYIMVETILVFVPFMILIVSIYSLIGLSFVHMRVHHALAQTASQAAMYGYLFRSSNSGAVLNAYGEVYSDVLSAGDGVNKIVGGIQNIKDLATNLDFADPLSSFEEAKASVGEIKGGASELKGLVDKYTEDAGNTFELLLYAGGGLSLNMVTDFLSNIFFKNKFSIGDENYKTFCKRYHIEFKEKGLGPVKVEPINYKDNILKMKVSYTAKFNIGRIVLPFEPKIDINQQVQTKLWIGYGERYGQ